MFVQMSTLGSNGRFANQIFQYFFLKILELELGVEIRYPMWDGVYMFKIPPTPDGIKVGTSVFEDGYPEFSARSTLDLEVEKVRFLVKKNPLDPIDLIGFYQFDTIFYKKYKNLFQKTFSFNELVRGMVEPVINEFKKSNKKITAIHVRRGDYLLEQKKSPLFWCHNVESIVSTIQQCSVPSLSDSIFYLASDETALVARELHSLGIDCVCADDLFGGLSDIGRMSVDFYMLANADALLISNSSFSFSASMLNNDARAFFRPNPKGGSLIAYDPWNSQTLLTKDIAVGQLSQL